MRHTTTRYTDSKGAILSIAGTSVKRRQAAFPMKADGIPNGNVRSNHVTAYPRRDKPDARTGNADATGEWLRSALMEWRGPADDYQSTNLMQS